MAQGSFGSKPKEDLHFCFLLLLPSNGTHEGFRLPCSCDGA